MGTALARAQAGERGSRSGAVAGRYATASALYGPAQGPLRGAVRGSRPPPALHAAQEDRSFTLSSEPGLSRTGMRAGTAGRARRLVARRYELPRSPKNGAGDRGTQGVYPGLAEVVRPLSIRPHRTGRAEDSQQSCARIERDGRVVTLRIVRLGVPRDPQEGIRVGTVRRPPRGVRKNRYARD